MNANVTGSVQLVGNGAPDSRHKPDYSGVVVWLTSPATLSAQSAGKHAVMLQKGKTFTPHILPIQAGTSVDFPNLDPIFHNAFSNFDGEIFDIGLYPPGQSRSVRFERPGIVRVFCNIHPSMSAIILVLNSPYFAVSGRSGEYKIENVPRGTYNIHFFHERATSTTLDTLTQRVTVSSTTCVPLIRISESGYLPVAHKNKYGQDYPPANDDAGSYKAPVK
ncbi:MAG TPA: hypothetical protein VKW78_09700 [Terriglobales bacterium]|jgi:plastocyanin|nr:hypothetical protein [Terriglobales bacterium]